MTATATKYSGAAAAQAAGITYRQLDYWARIGVPVGSGHAGGSGSRRTYTDDDVRVLTFLGRLATLIPGPVGRRPSPAAGILAAVGAQLLDDLDILDQPLVFITTRGRITQLPCTSGWVVAA